MSFLLSIQNVSIVRIFFSLPVKVPTACAAFPDELLVQPQSIISQRFPNIIQYNFMPTGGHFAAFEEPKLMADDIFSFVKNVQGMKKQKGKPS